jgi:hypothetical protein
MNSFVYKCQGKAHTYNLFQNQKSTHTHTVYGWLKKKTGTVRKSSVRLCPCQQSVKKMTINVIQHDDRL